MTRRGEVCSGHGTCECGICRCDVNEDGRFSGKFCEKCPTCLGLCHELKTCVECQMYKTGPLAASEGMCAKNCTKIYTTGVDTIGADEERDEHLCTFYDDDNCRFQFVYTDDYINSAFEVRAQKERACPQVNYVNHFVFRINCFSSSCADCNSDFFALKFLQKKPPN